MTASTTPGQPASPESARPSSLRRVARLVLLLFGNLLLLAFVLVWSKTGPDARKACLPLSVQLIEVGQAGTPPTPELAGRDLQVPWKMGSDRVAVAQQSAHTPWLRIRFQIPEAPADDIAAYFSYLEPGAGVYLNGAYLRKARGLETALRSAWSVPEYFALPSSLLKPGDNEIDIQLRPGNGGALDVGKVFVGPDAALRPFFKHRLRIQSMGIQIVCLLVGLMGSVNFLIWWQRREELVYGLFSFGCLLSIFRNLEYFLSDPPIAVPAYLVGCELSRIWLAALVIHTCEIIIDRPQRRLTHLGYGLAIACTVLVPVTGVGLWSGIADALTLLLGLALAARLTVEAWRRQQLTYDLLWCAVFVTAAGSLYEFLQSRSWIHAETYNLVPYGWLLFARAISWLLVDGFIKALDRREALNQQLEKRVEAFGRQLEVQYAHTTALERRNAAIEERERILRDMHDGLGFHLVSAIAQVASRELNQQELVAVFSNALAELRSTLNATVPERGNLHDALEGLRARLEASLEKAGIALGWSVDVELRTCELRPDAVQNVIAIVQEALSNAIRHSQSTVVRVEARVDPDGGPCLRVIDDGTGFRQDVARRGEGLVTMRWRAQKVGAALEVHSRPGCTEVILWLPVVIGQTGTVVRRVRVEGVGILPV